MSEKPDIVERLRRDQYKECDCWRCVVCEDAADEIERLRAALKKIAEHHEDQAEAWGGEEGDSNNVRYHSERARIANAAYDPPV